MKLIEPILVGQQGQDRQGRCRCRDRPRRHARSSTPSTASTPPAKAVALAREGSGRRADEGQPAHRRADERGGRARDRAAHRPAHQPLLHHGRARPRGRADHHRRRGQHRPRPQDQGRHRPERDRPRPRARRARSRWWRSSARWRPINPDVPSTLEAAALCKMADRGQITGGVLDGPLALDNAISPEAAAVKKIVSPVAGKANVLVVPDLEAGNMLAKSLSFLAGADAAGIVLGAQRADHPHQPRRRAAARSPRRVRGRAAARRRSAAPSSTRGRSHELHRRHQRRLLEHQVRALRRRQRRRAAVQGPGREDRHRPADEGLHRGRRQARRARVGRPPSSTTRRRPA